MPKRRRRGDENRQPVNGTEGRVDQVLTGLSQIQDHVSQDPTQLEDAAVDDQRAVFEKIRGKEGRKARRRDEREARSERDDDDDEELEDEEAELDEYDDDDDEQLEDETDDFEEEADEERGRRRRGEGKSLEGAINALRRINAPDWVFRQKPERIRDLASSMANWQGHHDRALQERDDQIRTLESRTQREAAEENPASDRAVHAEEDLEEAASQLAVALGIEADTEARRALTKALKTASGNGKAEQRAARAEQSAAGTSALLDQMLVLTARGELADDYPQLVSDSSALDRFQTRVVAQAKTGSYKGRLLALFQDAALLEFGQPQEKKDVSRRKRKTRNRPVTTTRRVVEAAAEPGSERHSRKVYDKIRRRSKKGLARRR